jgi:DNA-binding FrmR family transcriptional regulator
MAAGQHKLSRRALLAGACAGVVADARAPLLRHPRLDPGPRNTAPGANAPPSVFLGPGLRRDDEKAMRAWRKALARLTRAQAEIDALAHTDDQRRYDRAVDRQIAALSRLLKVPAPNLAAVAAKLDLLERHAAWELRCGDAAFVMLREDVQRLSGEPCNPPRRGEVAARGADGGVRRPCAPEAPKGQPG